MTPPRTNSTSWALSSTFQPLRFATDFDLDYRYICGADAVHHLYLAEYKKAYPDAKLIGVAALVTKRNDLKFDGGTLLSSPWSYVFNLFV